MANARSSHLLRQVRTLFGAGAVTGFSDAQLLEQFASRSAAAVEDTLAAEAAFGVLVARHGPMVLGVCRRALADPADVDDAFQATFLVLVRRASSVRAGDSLGRWLYGVARKVAARARVRSQRERSRTTSLDVEPTARESAPDQAGLLAALEEEVSRLPEKFRAPVVLCHLAGLSHAEAAARLRWPIGTVSGRLSRARGLLKDRLARRGVAPNENSLGMLLAADTIRVAVPEPLVSATIRTAVRLSMGGASPAGLASSSASALALMNGFLRAAVAFKLKTAATILLALGLAGVVAAGAGGTGNRAEKQGLGSEPAGASQSPPRRSAPHRPADQIVKDIETLLKTTRRPMRHEDHDATHEKIAKLIDELRIAYPDDPRVARYLPERWTSLSYIQKRELANGEIDTVLRTTENLVLRNDALFLQTCFRFLEPIDGSTAVSLAESFLRQAPGDPRASEFLYMAATRFDAGWMTRLSLIVIAVVVASLTLIPVRKGIASTRRWLKPAVRLAGLMLLMFVSSLCVFRWLAPNVFAALIGSLNNTLSDAALRQRCLFIASAISNEALQHLKAIAASGRIGVAVSLAMATGLLLFVVRNRSAATAVRWVSPTRVGILGFVTILAVGLAVDTWLVTRRRDAILERIVREYPDSFRGRMVQGERRQRARVGEPFELEFTDAITGRPVSMKALRGRVVVVDFWATWCGPCVGEIPELQRLYTKYHDEGVEFIGISHDAPEEDGGLEALKTFVNTWHIPWPQYFQGVGNQAVATASPTNNFSESWGISGIPTTFIIDTEGMLYSTEARGKLDTLIPRLLKNAGGSVDRH
jgi:RNA polymerase sigma factor (sigma-70 family)